MTVVATVYDRTNTTWICDLVVEDDGVQQAPVAAKGQEQLNRANDCSVTVAATHPNVDELQHLRVVRVSDGDISLPPFRIRSVKTTVVGEERLVTASGPTLLDVLSDALMRGDQADLTVEPQSNRRMWWYATPSLPTTNWTAAPILQDRSDTNPPAPMAWMDSFAAWVWPAAEGTHATDSWSYWRREFTLDEDVFVIFSASFDDYGDFCCDGVQLFTIRQEFPAEVYKRTYRQHVFLEAGTHLFAARSYNLFASGAFRASAFTTDDQVNIGEPIFTTGEEGESSAIGDWQVLYDAEPPGATVGQIVIESIESAQDDGSALPGVTCGFSATVDSNGDAWEAIGEFGIDVDAKVGELVDKLTPFADFAMADNGLELLAFRKDPGRGEPSGLTFTAGENLLSLTRTVEV